LEEVWGQGKLEVADEILSPDYVDHVVKGPEAQTVRGPDALKQAAAMFRAAFPDLTYSVEDVVAEGDKVVARFSATGTHLGEFMGVAPTGRKITYTGFDMSRISGGQIVEAWASYDALALMQQIGAISMPEQPE
jgi:predicted ester cyclase